MIRVALMLVLPLALLVSCHCNSNPNACPAEFTISDPCTVENLTCPYPGTCGTSCTCKNQVGGFRWLCDVTYCECTCPCGKIAISTCETLQCKRREDPCPDSEEAQTLCAKIVCIDAGAPDLRQDLRPRDALGDRLRDVNKDAPRDTGKAPVDAPAETRLDAPLGGGN